MKMKLVPVRIIISSPHSKPINITTISKADVTGLVVRSKLDKME